MNYDRLYRFSITKDTEQGTHIISDCILGKDIFFAEFNDFWEAVDYLKKCFICLGIGKHYVRAAGVNYNFYMKREN